MKIDPSPAQANDELRFIKLTGRNDDVLDQELVERIRRLRKGYGTPGMVFMMLAKQLPTHWTLMVKLIAFLNSKMRYMKGYLAW